MKNLILILSILFLYSCDDFPTAPDLVNAHENAECMEDDLVTCWNWSCAPTLDECPDSCEVYELVTCCDSSCAPTLDECPSECEE